MKLALNKRERNLAIATGGLAGLVLLYLLASTLFNPHQALKAQRNQANTELQRRQTRVEHGLQAMQQLEAWRKRSLPSNPEAALSLYQNWLLQTARDAGLSDISIDAVPARRRPNVYQALRFTLQAAATLDELTAFLHDFYQAGHLHQILAMGLAPEGRDGQLEVQITVEALSLPTADQTEELAAVPSEHNLATLDTYRDSIGKRNLFAAYEPPPQPTAEAPLPAPPSPPAPHFDPAKHAYLTAIVSADGRPQAWILARTTGETSKLFEGDSFEIGGVEGKVLRIDQREVDLEFDGRQYTLPLGQNLRAPAQ